MQTAKIGKHVVEFFDAIEELPIVRFHKYEKLLLVDAGIGADIAAFDQRTERMRQFLAAGKPDKAEQELENMRQCVYMIQTGLNPRHLAFAALVSKIDGKACNDLSDDALAEITKKLNDSPAKKLAALLDAAKKKN